MTTPETFWFIYSVLSIKISVIIEIFVLQIKYMTNVCGKVYVGVCVGGGGG
jgi:hypothetical protein